MGLAGAAREFETLAGLPRFTGSAGAGGRHFSLFVQVQRDRRSGLLDHAGGGREWGSGALHLCADTADPEFGGIVAAGGPGTESADGHAVEEHGDSDVAGY